MRTYRTLQEVSEEYFKEHPDEIEDFLKIAFAAYQVSGSKQVVTGTVLGPLAYQL